MKELVSQKEMHERAIKAFRKRIDIGLCSAIANTLLESRNPFQLEEKRRPTRGFVLAMLIAAMMMGSFIYFNFLS